MRTHVLVKLLLAWNASIALASYAQTCDQFSISTQGDRVIMQTSCTPRDQSGRRYTELDLDVCITNNGGALYFQNNGGLGGSCSGCSVQNGFGTYMECVCSGGLDPFGRANINLDDVISNEDGHLRCFDNYGS